MDRFTLYEPFTEASEKTTEATEEKTEAAEEKIEASEKVTTSYSAERAKSKEANKDVVGVVEQIFKNAKLPILAILLIVYLVVFMVLGGTSKTMFDIALFGGIAVYVLYQYMQLDLTERENSLNLLLSKFVGLYDDDLSLYSVMLFVVCFYLLLFLLRIPTGENRPVSVSLIEGGAWFLLSTLVVHQLLKYFFDVDILDNLRENDYQMYLDNVMATDAVGVDASGNAVDADGKVIAKDDKEPEPTPEVFNIASHVYTYDDAQAVCKSMDARLATYDEIETAYNNGAEWCAYGWSDGQMALFPTQKETWNELQKSDCRSRKRNSCGRPGINGGYFRNPNIKFGANCFGIKPKAKDGDLEWMDARKDGPVARTHQDARMNAKVEHYKNNADNLLVNSFNKDKWSRY